MYSFNEAKSFSKLIIHLIFILFCIACIIPIILIISISFSNEESIATYGYKLIPRVFDTLSYRIIFKNPKSVINAYSITVALTAAGTSVSLLLNSLIAYPLSLPNFKYKNKITFFLFFTMLFNGGLVPTYMLISQYLHLNDTFWVLFLPGAVSAWHIIIFRTFMQSLPVSLIEAALIDGANDFKIYYSIIVPLSKPAFATLGLFAVLGYWNDWFTALIYIRNQNLVPIQYLLQKTLANIEFIKENMRNMGGQGDAILKQLPTESVRMAMCILVVVPILLIFPFFQKYFVSGLTIGSVKG